MPRPASAGCLRAGSAKNLRRPVSAFSRGFGVGLNTGSVSAVGSEAKLVGDAVRGKSISGGQQEASRRPKSVVEFMRMHEAKHRRDEQRLAALIERTNHEAEFALLRKMTELNQVVESERQSGEAIVYKMLDGSRKGERVGCYVGAELVGKMSVEAFERKYKTLVKSKSEKSFPQGGTSQTIGNKSTMAKAQMSAAEQAERQNEIGKVLAHTMRLTAKLREQLRIIRQGNPHARTFCESESDGIGFAPFVVE
ncbi:hypothetical protein FOZ62_006941 [Perkinsus olseni]|uniref:Uncharacterized protein n=2 Tax=Perkinsus olseni TaxID=32597 RepID=A0A7J6T7B6_PEROL|nr:hypothetical protein FOZ62_006941 [Perkinsus olseni]